MPGTESLLEPECAGPNRRNSELPRKRGPAQFLRTGDGQRRVVHPAKDFRPCVLSARAMLLHGLGAEVPPAPQMDFLCLAAPSTCVESALSEFYTSVTLSVTPSLEGGTSQSTWTVSIVSGMDVIYEMTNTNAVTYVYANGMRIARIDCTGNPPTCTTSYYLADHLGSSRKVLRADRSTAFTAEYEPFGTPYNVTGTESYKVHDGEARRSDRRRVPAGPPVPPRHRAVRVRRSGAGVPRHAADPEPVRVRRE